ncbi:MAG: 1,4-dihydroxy-6-naphthoate synthase [Saprospiraceae bacterium]|nr:1,4-dihydroxy-6-naphthoate synthase [Saprospiraceae bacterium]
MNRSLKLAISPCPNDTYIFGAWINGLINEDPAFKIHAEYYDIQQLNELARDESYDLIKISAAQIKNLRQHYQILTVGAAMGEDNGPLLISHKWKSGPPSSLWTIAIPGYDTTAYFLLKHLFPGCIKTTPLLFSKIEDRVMNDHFDAGLIIHESRFTYQSKNLHLIEDLGSLWVNQTGLPIPLGVIAIRRNLDPELKMMIKIQIQRSLEYAYQHFDKLLPFIKSYAHEMDAQVILDHIRLYVNKYSQEIGPLGKKAICFLNQLPTEPNDEHLELFI